MPQAPRKPCRSPGCGVLTSASYCGKHERVKEAVQRESRIKYDKERGTSASRGYGSRWGKAAKQYRVNNPLCCMCQEKGILKLNNCVDHVVAVSGPDDPLFWDESNWQGLCTPCHSEKTAKEDSGFGNERKERFI